MTHPPAWRRYLRFWRADVDADVNDELRFHFEARTEALRARGLSPLEIERTIAEEFGDVEATRRQLRDIGHRVERHRQRAQWWRELRADLAYAARGLRRQPAFTAATLITLTIATGASSAMLSVAKAALVGSVPFPNAGRLVHLWERREDSPAGRENVSYADLADWREGARSFAALEAYDETNVTLTGVEVAERLQGARVTPGFFAALGVLPRLGRGFVRDDERADAGTVVVSHRFWERRLGGGPDALGRTITLDGQPATVVGVLPADFLFAPAGDVEVWLPIDEMTARNRVRSDRWLRVVGRLHEGVTTERATTELAALMHRLAEEHPESNAERSAYTVALRDEIIGSTRPLLLALAGAVALVLLVACANVASLFLGRALTRSREVAVRVALGASPGRIVRQLLTESVLVALVGGAAGAGLAWAGVRWLAAAAPPHITSRMPFLRALAVDERVLAGALAIALATGVAFGLAPAIHAMRLSLSALGRRGDDGSAGSFGSRAWRTLIVAEIALTTMLLVGTGLMMRSMMKLLDVDPGFRTERVATMRIALAGQRYDDEPVQQRFFEELVTRARALPGVHDVGAVSQLPLSGGGSSTFHIEGEPESGAATRPTAMVRAVAGDYFRALGIPIVEGRAIGSNDDSLATRAVVISSGLAHRLFGNATAIDHRLRFDADPGNAWTIVGVAGDVRAASLDAPPPAVIYRSHLQAAENRMTLVLGVAGGAQSEAQISALLSAMRSEVRALDPLLPPYQVGTLAEQVASTPAVYLRRSLLMLLAGFAGVTTLLAAVGVYGVIAYSVARRMRELGIRAALGATPKSLRALLLRQGLTLAVAGIGVGLVASGAVGRFLRSLLYELQPTDGLTYGACALLLIGVSLLASVIPAWRAGRVNPAELLRAE